MTPSFRRRYTVQLAHGRTLDLGARTLVMGILNVTPDSFSDGGQHLAVDRAVAAAQAMVVDGADLIDVGGESTRPGAAPISAEEECARVIPVIEALARDLAVPLSIDTTKATVARAALEAGAALVNDISGLRSEPELAAVVADRGAGLVLMHMRGMPQDMYRHASYADPVVEVAEELAWSVSTALAAGISRSALVLDPGIGFAKQPPHSWQVLARLDHPALRGFDLPLLVGASRKSFLQTAIGERPPAQREAGSLAAATVAALSGAHIVRVHDVPGSVQAVRVADMICATTGPASR